jgi:hypothetical protein
LPWSVVNQERDVLQEQIEVVSKTGTNQVLFL